MNLMSKYVKFKEYKIMSALKNLKLIQIYLTIKAMKIMKPLCNIT